MAIKRSRVTRHLACPALASLLAGVACSAPLDAGDDGGDNGPPPFSGTANPSTNGVAPAPNGATNGSPNPSGAANAAEGRSNAAPLSPATPPLSATPPSASAPGNAGANQGAGGSASVSPASGAAGASMVPPVQPGSMGVAGGSMLPPNNPPVTPPVVTPPPNNPPVVTPPPVTPPVGTGCGDAALFCEDFEGINIGALTATVNGLRPERTVSVFAEPGRGRVLRVQAGSGFGNKSGVFLDAFTPPNNSYYGRAFMRVAQFPTAGGDHWVIVEATANNGGELARPVGGQFSRWAPGSDGPTAGDWTDWAESDAATTAGVWECVEWQMNGANGANDMLLWVNGEEVQPLDRPNFRLPVVNRLWLGFVVFQNGQPPTYDVRFDDVVLSTERVGCD